VLALLKVALVNFTLNEYMIFQPSLALIAWIQDQLPRKPKS